MIRHPHFLAIRPHGNANRIDANMDASSDLLRCGVNDVDRVSRRVGHEHTSAVDSNRIGMGTGERRMSNSQRLARTAAAIPAGRREQPNLRKCPSAGNGDRTKYDCAQESQAKNGETVHCQVLHFR